MQMCILLYYCYKISNDVLFKHVLMFNKICFSFLIYFWPVLLLAVSFYNNTMVCVFCYKAWIRNMQLLTKSELTSHILNDHLYWCHHYQFGYKDLMARLSQIYSDITTTFIIQLFTFFFFFSINALPIQYIGKHDFLQVLYHL